MHYEKFYSCLRGLVFVKWGSLLCDPSALPQNANKNMGQRMVLTAGPFFNYVLLSLFREVPPPIAGFYYFWSFYRYRLYFYRRFQLLPGR